MRACPGIALCLTPCLSLSLVGSPTSGEIPVHLPRECLLVPYGVGDPPDPRAGSVGMFSPVDGSYLGDLVPPDPERIVFPNTAAIGPDGLVYVSDSVVDAVHRYTLEGVLVDEFVGASDGLDNVRGIAFDGADLLVANNPASGGMIDRENVAVLRYGADGERGPALLPPGSGISAWRIEPTRAGTYLIGNVNDFRREPIREYSSSGELIGELVAVPFSTQIAEAHRPGEFVSFSLGGRAYFFDRSGLIRTRTIAGLTNAGQGLYPLRNGDLLVTNFNSGVYRHAANGSRRETIREGFGIYGTISYADFCRVDIVRDGVLDLGDIDAFVSGFLARDPGVDFARPFGVFDLVDITRFVSAFSAGC